MKKNSFMMKLPNILTFFRIIVTPFIILFGILGLTELMIGLAVIAAITDLFDGKIARKYGVCNQFGAKLDALADKIFSIGLIISLIFAVSNGKILLVIILLLEFIIGGFNLYFFSKLKRSETLMIGKVKTTSLFVTIILATIYIVSSKVYFLLHAFMYMTINLQVLSFVSYCFNYKYKMDILKKPILDDDSIHDKIMNEEIEDDISNTLKIDNLNDLIDDMEDIYMKED